MQYISTSSSTFPDVSLSTTAGLPPHRALQLRRDEITTAASQLEAHLQPASVKQFQENHNIVWQSACQRADRGPGQCFRRFQPKR